jgi:hypothetical protein
MLGEGYNTEAVRRSTCHAPRHLAFPISGVAGRPAGPAGCQLTHPSPHPSTSPGSPTWASMVRGDMGARGDESTCPRQPPAITAADFTVQYERCVATGLKACVVISHAAGCQVITISCNLPAPAKTSTAAGRRRRHRQRHSRAACAAGGAPAQETYPVVADLVSGIIFLPTCTLLPPSRPDITSPPAKKSRRRCNEVEILQDSEGGSKLLLSPLSCPATQLPTAPHPKPTS